MVDKNEYITGVAMKLRDGSFVSLPAPNAHVELFRKYEQHAPFRIKDQGFVTNKNRFVDRYEACQIAFDANQVTRPDFEMIPGCLVSEMLWGYEDE